jgi:hypothetical protein
LHASLLRPSQASKPASLSSANRSTRTSGRIFQKQPGNTVRWFYYQMVARSDQWVWTVITECMRG